MFFIATYSIPIVSVIILAFTLNNLSNSKYLLIRINGQEPIQHGRQAKEEDLALGNSMQPLISLKALPIIYI